MITTDHSPAVLLEARRSRAGEPRHRKSPRLLDQYHRSSMNTVSGVTEEHADGTGDLLPFSRTTVS